MAAHKPAPPQCSDRDVLLAWLFHEYRETPAAMALTNSGYVFEIIRSKNGETYTLLIRGPSGPTCVIGAGRDWEDIPFQAPSVPAS